MGRARIKTDEPDRPGLPVTFRPGPDLEQLARPFVERHKLAPAVAFKCLAALALIGLDQRHYSLVVQLAKVFVGDNPFPRACVYIQAAFAGVAAVRNGLVVVDEPHRSQLVFDVVRDYLRERDVEVDTTGLWFTPAGSFAKTLPEREPDDEPVTADKPTTEPTSGQGVNRLFDKVVKRTVRSRVKEEERAAQRRAEDGEDDTSQ